MIDNVVEGLEDVENVSEVIVSTNDGECFRKAVGVYGDYMRTLIAENKISIDI